MRYVETLVPLSREEIGGLAAKLDDLIFDARTLRGLLLAGEVPKLELCQAVEQHMLQSLEVLGPAMRFAIARRERYKEAVMP